MKKAKKIISFVLGTSLLVAFVVWTVLVRLVDVQAIGPRESAVGFATINGFVHRTLGVHMALYTITDWLGLVPIAVALGFAILGLVQWIKRRKLKKVDKNLFVLGAFYIVVVGVYALFEVVAINCRPVLIEDRLETSYPSSTTMLVLCVMPTALMQLWGRIKKKPLRWIVAIVIVVFTIFMVVGRLVSGVHWFSDILGGAFFSGGVVLLYYGFCKCVE